ncbi:hypothetical protein ACPPVO_34700 [Dactylosporangium sp. McL0621]
MAWERTTGQSWETPRNVDLFDRRRDTYIIGYPDVIFFVGHSGD